MARHRPASGAVPEPMRDDADPLDGPALRVDDPAAVRADDEMLDELATRRAVELFPSDSTRVPGGDAVETILASWRQDFLPDDLPPVPSLGRADWALRQGQGRGFRPMVAAAAAIAVLLVGSALVGSRMARPGDPLWGLTRVLWTDRVDSADAEHAAQVGLTSAQDELNKGHLTGASVALTFVSATLPKVQPRDDLDKIRRTYESLASQVSSRMESEKSSSASVAATAGPVPHPGGTQVTSSPAPASNRSSSEAAATATPAHRASSPSVPASHSSSAAVTTPATSNPGPVGGGGVATTPSVAPAPTPPASSTSQPTPSGTGTTPTTSVPTSDSPPVTSSSVPIPSTSSTADLPNLNVTSSPDTSTGSTTDSPSIPAAVPTTLPTGSSTDDPTGNGQSANQKAGAADSVGDQGASN